MHIQSSNLYSNVTTSTRINSSMYIRTSVFVSFETTFQFCSAMVCWPIIQHGVRIEAVFASLQQGEHMVESTAVSCIQSSHPDKYNNSANRIISKEEEREDIQGEILQSSSTVFPHTIHPSYKNYSVSTSHPATPSFHKVILHTELILPQEILQLQDSSHADQHKASSSNCPCVSKHFTWQNKAPGSPTAQAGFQQFYPAETAF